MGDMATAARGFVPDGVDAVLALAGDATLDRCLEAVRDGGTATIVHNELFSPLPS
jgi:hypothetical protein